MTVQIIPPVTEMTTAELDELIEALQEVRFIRSEREAPPEWHGEVLRQREEAIKNGTDRFLTLDEVEARLRERAILLKKTTTNLPVKFLPEHFGVEVFRYRHR